MGQLDKVRADLESAVVRLAAQRAAIETELKQMMLMLKIIAPPKKANGKKKKRVGAADPLGFIGVALKLADKAGIVTPASLAKRTGQSPLNAGQVLMKMVQRKQLERKGHGVYARKS